MFHQLCSPLGLLTAPPAALRRYCSVFLKAWCCRKLSHKSLLEPFPLFNSPFGLLCLQPQMDEKIQLGPRAQVTWVKGSSGGAKASDLGGAAVTPNTFHHMLLVQTHSCHMTAAHRAAANEHVHNR